MIEHHAKLWGEELWIVNNNRYCGKRLHLLKGFQCSLHYHRDKDETFWVESGLVMMETRTAEGTRLRDLHPGESMHIRPGVVHRFTGLEESVIFEFSTHHRDDDSYRLEPSRAVPDAMRFPLPEEVLQAPGTPPPPAQP